MNTDLIVQLREDLESLSTEVKNISKIVNALKINDQYRLNANTDIPPGIACKIAYDKHGLVLKGTSLEETDIPELSIDKISSLRKSLEDKASIRDFNVFKSSINQMIKPISDEMKEIVGTGVKVNYNTEGRIVSTSELLPSDIPILPITKIEGLYDVISSINDMPMSDEIPNNISKFKVFEGTFAKVTIDKYGRVISGHKLNIDDIPMELINRIIKIENNISNLASNSSLDTIIRQLHQKVNSNEPITPGSYTKVKVDQNGLVTKGEKLTIRDLPNISIKDIDGLEKELRSKADRSDIINLNDTVSSLVSSVSKIGELSGMKRDINSKASDEDLKRVENKVNSMKYHLDSLINNLPSDMIDEQFQKIEIELSNINSKLAYIETKLKIEDF